MDSLEGQATADANVDFIGRSARKPGAVICGKWRIEALLRSTATSATYSALHRNGARVALKILHAHLSSDKSLQARFRREAYVANTISHPDTVKVIDDDETDDGCALLVMDHFDGETLEELRVRRGGKVPLEVACAFADQLLDIIAAAHDQGMVHRDIKGETVFVTKEGRIKVHDFGTARVLSETAAPQEMTAAGMVIGSPSSMAPEQARGQRDQVDAQSDIFSLGALLFTLLSGEPVHKIANPLAALVAAAKSKAPSLRTVVDEDEVPDAVVEVVDRALQFKKIDRWPDARAFRAALRAARGELIDTFPQAGRRDPLADLMGETSETPLLLLDEVQMTPAVHVPHHRPPPIPSAPLAPPAPESAPGRAKPPPIPQALPSKPAESAPAARVANSGPERRAAERGRAPVVPPPIPAAKPSWQDEEDVEDEATIAQSNLDPSLMQALADVRRDAVAVAPTRSVPRIGPSASAGPPRPGGIPRPGPRTVPPPKANEPEPAATSSERSRGAPPPQPATTKMARVEAPVSARGGPPSLPLALPAAPPAPAPYVEKDPRFATVMMAGSPALPSDASAQRPVYQAEIVSDPVPGYVPRGPAPSAPPGFAFLPPQNVGPFPPPLAIGRPSPFEMFDAAPPTPYTPPPPMAPEGAFPGRRLSYHEDLRIMVPEQSYALDHNPFADAARRKKRITIGVIVGIVAIVAIALFAMARSG